MLFLTGIHDPAQLRGFDPARWPGIRRRIAIDLIDEIDGLGDPGLRVALFERIVDVRGAFKRTYPDRFAAFDALVMEAWRSSGPKPQTISVLDAGVSDGSTSLPLIAAFAGASEGRFRFIATDLDGRYVRLSRRRTPQRRVILDAAGEIVQIILPPFLFTHRESRYLFPVNRLLRPSAVRFAEAMVAAWRKNDPDVEAREILLLAPDLRRRVAEDPRVSFQRWDILEPWAGEKAHCVRAMNVLNPGYFDAAQMKRVVRNLVAAAADGGILAFGSNEDAGTPVDGIVCRRSGDRLEILANSGNGFRAPDALDGLLSVAQ
jgi:hypothetical protein